MTDARVSDANLRLAVERFAEDLLVVPFGSLAKSETQYLIFRLLLESGVLVDSQDDFRIANRLGLAPSRVRSLRYRLDQARVQSGESSLLEVLKMDGYLVAPIEGSEKVRVQFTRQYVREHFLSVLRSRRVVESRTLSPDVIEVDPSQFLKALFDELSEEKPTGERGKKTYESIETVRADLETIISSQVKDERLSAAKRVGVTIAREGFSVALQTTVSVILKALQVTG